MSTSIQKSFGSKIRAERIARNWSQEDFADKASLDRTYISGIERGLRNPSLKNIHKIAKALGVNTGQLFN
jgi:transcriptional regulator with XRE-family HTH domain